LEYKLKEDFLFQANNLDGKIDTNKDYVVKMVDDCNDSLEKQVNETNGLVSNLQGSFEAFKTDSANRIEKLEHNIGPLFEQQN
jgi:hypothetical protein